MVDIHCHILPDVDDGAESFADALEMAYMSASCGVTDLVATSHIRGSEAGLEETDRLRRQFALLQEAVSRENIPLGLHLGAEILCTRETPALARPGRLPTLGNTDYALCEFFFDAPFSHMDEILADIARAGYRPVIAHPERYDAILEDRRRILGWFREGYVIQVNKGSLLGAFGSRVRDTACRMLDAGLLHLIASDAHSPIRRTTDLTPLRQWLLERYPEGYVRLLLEDNPGRLIRGQAMAPIE